MGLESVCWFSSGFFKKMINVEGLKKSIFNKVFSWKDIIKRIMKC